MKSCKDSSYFKKFVLFIKQLKKPKKNFFRRGTMKMVHGKKSGYQSPQVQIFSTYENVLRTSFGMEGYDFSVDTEDWD